MSVAPSFALTKELQQSDVFKDLSALVTDIIYKIKSRYCYAFLIDDNYADTITPKLFDDIREHPVFVAKIKESADLLEPDTETYCMLSEIRKAKCDVYLVLLANGIQVERLLRYGDKTRVLNTRAKFIMLHDYRLYSQSMHYIWKRIVNVVFIRPYERSHRQGAINKVGRLFEISTVPFPVPLREVFVLRRLDFWQGGRYRYGRDFFHDRTTNLLGEEFKAVVLVHTPGAMKESVISTLDETRAMNMDYDNDTDYENVEKQMMSYSGLEVNIVNALSNVMNFTPIYYEPMDAETEKWGERRDNVSFTGVLGEMDAAQADFAIADLYYTGYHLDVLDLSIPYMVECLTFLTPEATTDNSWLTLILPFSPQMWAGVLVSLFSVGTIFYSVSLVYNNIQRTELKGSTSNDSSLSVGKKVLKRLQKKTPKVSDANLDQKLTETKPIKVKESWNDTVSKELKPKVVIKSLEGKKHIVKDMFDDFSNCIIYTYSMLLFVSLPKFPLNWSLRLLTGWYWIYCILIVVAYRASMTAILSRPIPR